MNNIAAAIDFGTSKIVTLIAESGGLNKCNLVGTGNVPYDGYLDGNWNSPDEVLDAIRNSVNAAELEAKSRIREIYVGVPCEYIRTLNTEAEIDIGSEDGRVSDEDVLAVQDAAADSLHLPITGATVIHRSPAWFSVDGGKRSMTPVGAKGRRLRALVSFIVADSLFIEDVCGMLGKLGISVLGFLSPALGDVMLLLSYEDRDKAAVLIDAGYLNTEVSVAQGDAIVYHAVLPMGGGDITAALVDALRIPMRAAEQVKREFKLDTADFDPDFDQVTDVEVRDEGGVRRRFEHDMVKGVVEDKLNQFVDMIAQTIEDADPFLTARSQVFMTGGALTQMNGGREYVANRLGRPVKVPLLRAAKLNGAMFASALGLVDLVFDSIESKTAQEESFPGRLAESIRGLLHKK